MKIRTQIEFTDYTENFRALGKYRDQDVIIDGVIPGETADVLLTDKIDEVYYGKAEKITRPSKLRTKPTCKFYGQCSNCSLQHLDYQAQTDSKIDILKKRIDGISGVTVEPMQRVFFPYKYRNHIALAFSHKKDEIVLGYKDLRTGLVNDIDSCAVCDKWVALLIKTIKSFCGKFKIKSYSSVTGEGKLIGLNAVFIDNRLMLSLECVSPSLIGVSWLYKELSSAFGGKVHLWLVCKTDAGMQYELIGGDKNATISFCGTKLAIKPNLRLSVNDKLFTKLFRALEERINAEFTFVSGDCSAIMRELLSDNKNVFIGSDNKFPIKKPLQSFVEIRDTLSDGQLRFLKTFRTKKLMVLVNDCDRIGEVVKALSDERYGHISILPYDMQPQTKKLTALLLCEA